MWTFLTCVGGRPAHLVDITLLKLHLWPPDTWTTIRDATPVSFEGLGTCGELVLKTFGGT